MGSVNRKSSSESERASYRREPVATPVPANVDPSPDSGSGRRATERRALLHGRKAAATGSGDLPGAPKGEIRVLPSVFPWMGLGIGLALILSMLLTMDLPTLLAGIVGFAGAAIAGASRYSIRWERDREPPERVAFAVGALIVGGSSMATGFALAHWTLVGGLDVRMAIAALVSINAVMTTILSRRTVLMLVGKISLWVPLVLLDGGLLAYAGLLIATVVALAVARYQIMLDRLAEEREEAQARIRDRAQSILADYEETGQGWFWETDRRGQLTYVSRSIVRMLRRKERSLIGRPFTSLFELSDDNRQGERTLTFHLSARSSFQELAVRAAVSHEERWWSINGRPIYDQFDNFCGFRGSGTDLTERKRSQENATRLAQYDSLTGLANRLQMSETLEKILQSPHERERECAVMLLDLDRFKNVNDTLGHPVGDALLKQVAQRLERAVGEVGRCGRLGGDEFKVIVPRRVPQERLAHLAHDIIHSLSQPYSIEGQRVVIGASVGIAVSPQDGESSESVIRNADLALYAAKDAGRGRFHFYSNDLHKQAEERSKLEQELRDAIASGDLQLYYQPVVDARNDRLSGFEALLRWHHGTHGWISPEKFIPIAEDSGLIGAIGEWVLRTACADLARWPESVRCAVNVSPLQFGNPQLPNVVTNAIAQAGIDPARLELEITESVFLGDDRGTDAMFAALKRVGVRLALDDFGTGYSSLGYLKRAPFDRIKIDQSFVRGATQAGSRNGAIIESITALARSLGMDTTAEGVETLDELELVKRYGCSHVQGYVFAKALSRGDAGELIADGLDMVPSGPKSSRPPRQKMLRKVAIEHQGHRYQGTIRNMSQGGACVEGLWNVPPGTEFAIMLSDSVTVYAVSIWSEEDRMGVRFAEPLLTEADGSISMLAREQGPGRGAGSIAA